MTVSPSGFPYRAPVRKHWCSRAVLLARPELPRANLGKGKEVLNENTWPFPVQRDSISINHPSRTQFCEERQRNSKQRNRIGQSHGGPIAVCGVSTPELWPRDRFWVSSKAISVSTLHSFMFALPVLLISFACMNPNKFSGAWLLRKSLYRTGSFQSLSLQIFFCFTSSVGE